jgi:hypothetical protein
VLRICQKHTCRRQLGKHSKWSPWCSFKSFIHKKGQQWYGRARVWQEETIETYVSACWQEEYEEAWLIISAPFCRQNTHSHLCLAYARRIDLSGYQDAWLEHRSGPTQNPSASGTLAREPCRLPVWWVSHLAASCIHHGQRDRFDRHDRRDKGIFRLGRLWLRAIVRRARTPATLSRCLPFHKKGNQWTFALRF